MRKWEIVNRLLTMEREVMSLNRRVGRQCIPDLTDAILDHLDLEIEHCPASVKLVPKKKGKS